MEYQYSVVQHRWSIRPVRRPWQSRKYRGFFDKRDGKRMTPCRHARDARMPCPPAMPPHSRIRSFNSRDRLPDSEQGIFTNTRRSLLISLQQERRYPPCAWVCDDASLFYHFDYSMMPISLKALRVSRSRAGCGQMVRKLYLLNFVIERSWS